MTKVTPMPIRKAKWRSPKREDLPPTLPFLNLELAFDEEDSQDDGEHDFRNYYLELGEGITAAVWTHNGLNGWHGTVNLHELEVARVFRSTPQAASYSLGLEFIDAFDKLAEVRARLHLP